MFPVIVNIGPFTISSLGLFMSLAFFFGSFKVWANAKEEHFEDKDIFDIIFLVFFGGIIFARLFFILLNFGEFGFIFYKWISLGYSNGFSWLGFIIGAMIMLSLVCSKKKIDYWQFLDISVYGMIWAQIFMLFGLFLDGSYFGKVSRLPWAVNFPGIEGARHPMSFYEILVLIFLVQIEKWLDKRYRLFKWYQNKRGKANPGFLWLTYLFVFVIGQFLLSLLMVTNPILGPLTVYQLVLILSILVIGFVFWLRAGNEINLIDDSANIKKMIKEKDGLEVIRPASDTPVKKLEIRERPKRFKRAKKGKDYR